jgi:hypothetical protein
MSNPFWNLPAGRVPLQKKEGGEVKKKKAGRPRLDNMVSSKYRIDKGLEARFSVCLRKNHTSKSVVFAQLIKEYLTKTEL